MLHKTPSKIDIAQIICKLTNGETLVGFTPEFETDLIRGVMVERCVDLDEFVHQLRRSGIGILNFETIGDFHRILLLPYSHEN
jgi:hypothetical protein